MPPSKHWSQLLECLQDLRSSPYTVWLMLSHASPHRRSCVSNITENSMLEDRIARNECRFSLFFVGWVRRSRNPPAQNAAFGGLRCANPPYALSCHSGNSCASQRPVLHLTLFR